MKGEKMSEDRQIHDVMFRIVGTQMNRGEKDEQIEFITEGKYYEKNNAIYLIYKETEVLGIEGSVTTLKIKDDKVNMKRYGSVGNEMCFEKGKRVTGEYETPFGNMPMELLTNSVENSIDRDTIKGYIHIDYDLSIRGLTDSRNKLNVEIL